MGDEDDHIGHPREKDEPRGLPRRGGHQEHSPMEVGGDYWTTMHGHGMKLSLSYITQEGVRYVWSMADTSWRLNL